MPRKLKTKAEQDPILKAKTIYQLVKALNATYGLGWPLRFPKNKLLAELWKLGIEVKEGAPPRLYEADSTQAFELNDVLKGRVSIDIDTINDAIKKMRQIRKEGNHGQGKKSKKCSRKGSRRRTGR